MSSPFARPRHTRDSSAPWTSFRAPFTLHPSTPNSPFSSSLLSQTTWTPTPEIESSSTTLTTRAGAREAILSPSSPFSSAAQSYFPPNRSGWNATFSSAPEQPYSYFHGHGVFPSIPWSALSRPSERHAQRVWNVGVRITFWAALVVLFSALLGIGDTPQHGLSMREGPVEWMDGGLLMATWEKSEDGGLREMRGGGLSELKRAELHEDLGGYWAPVQSSGAARLPVRSNEEMKWGGWE